MILNENTCLPRGPLSTPTLRIDAYKMYFSKAVEKRLCLKAGDRVSFRHTGQLYMYLDNKQGFTLKTKTNMTHVALVINNVQLAKRLKKLCKCKVFSVGEFNEGAWLLTPIDDDYYKKEI